MEIRKVAECIPRERKVDGVAMQAAPLVYVNGGGFMELGLASGESSGDETSIVQRYMEPPSERGPRVLTYWRAMQIADMLTEFRGGDESPATLRSCYHAARRGPFTLEEAGWTQEVVSKIGGEQRQKVLGMLPEDLDKFVGELIEHGVGFDRRQFGAEAYRDRLGLFKNLSPADNAALAGMKMLLDESGYMR